MKSFSLLESKFPLFSLWLRIGFLLELQSEGEWDGEWQRWMRMSEEICFIIWRCELSCCCSDAAPCQRQSEEFKLFLREWMWKFSPFASRYFSIPLKLFCWRKKVHSCEPFLFCMFFSAKRKWTEWFISSCETFARAFLSFLAVNVWIFILNCLIDVFQRVWTRNVNKEWVLSFYEMLSQSEWWKKKLSSVENFLMFINAKFTRLLVFLKISWTTFKHSNSNTQWRWWCSNVACACADFIHISHQKEEEKNKNESNEKRSKLRFLQVYFSISSGWIMFSNYERRAAADEFV